MPTPQDTEITLGTGKMLLLFFGLVAVCAVFFGMGYSLGRSSARPLAELTSPVVPSTHPAAKAATPGASPDLSFYKTVEQKDTQAQLPAPAANSAPAAAPESAPQTPAQDNAPQSTDAAAAPVVNGYYVQVAAVTKQEDAQALVDALKGKQYAAFANTSAADKLFHVQIGPFGDIKDAEATRAKLVSDGYNPIVKK